MAQPLVSVQSMFNQNYKRGPVSTLLLLSLLGVVALHAGAIRNDPSYQVNVFAANDDGSTGPHDLGFNINLFGVSTTQAFVNNNGNLTIGTGLGNYTPFPLDTLG